MKFYNFIVGFFKLPLKLIFPMKVYGKRPLPKGGLIVASNHLSALDVFFPAIHFDRQLTFLSKEELWKSKIGAWFFKNMGAVAVSRSGNDFVVMKKIIGELKAEKCICLYPEGTRNKTGKNELLPFKGGVSMFALKSGASILPIVTLYRPRAFRKNYMLVGEEIPAEFEGKVTTEVVEQYTQNLQNIMQNMLCELEERVQSSKKR